MELVTPSSAFESIYSNVGNNYSLVNDPKDGVDSLITTLEGPGEGGPSGKATGDGKPSNDGKGSLSGGSSKDENKAEMKLGLFWGVYMPCVQNILGVILFLRLPWIVAQAGVWLTTVIVALCVGSTLLTAISLSAIATNGKIMAGGPYYVISRNLGIEIGGAIGVIFYLGTTMAASMYTLGAVEAIQSGFGLVGVFSFDKQIESLILIFLLASIVHVGVKYVNASASVFLFVVILSIFSSILGSFLYLGKAWRGEVPSDARASMDNMFPDFEPDKETGITPTFFSLIALFYPSCTGIMAGSNRSGVLQNPGKDIPTGTIGAILTTTAIYYCVIWLMGNILTNEYLKDDKLAFAAIAWPPVLVNIGIVLSSVGACLQSLTGAPRLLAAIANDGVIPFLDPFKCPGDVNPTRAVWMTWFIASLPCLAGNLDFITPIVTMFFLMMYTTVNLATLTLCILKAPGFRPTFRYFSVWSAALGFVWCAALMFMISWYVALIVFSLAFGLQVYIHSKHAERDWGDTASGFKFMIVRNLLRQMKYNAITHPKNWRPQLLIVFPVDKDGLTEYEDMLKMAGQMKEGRGLAMFVGTIQGDLEATQPLVEPARLLLEKYLEDQGIKAFSRIILCENRQQAFFTTIQTIGIGAMRPNAVMTYWWDDWRTDMESIRIYVKRLQFVMLRKQALLIYKRPMVKDVLLQGVTHPRPLDGDAASSSGAARPSTAVNAVSAGPRKGTIDVWWVVHDGGLLLLLPYLLTLHKQWAGCRIRLFAVTMASHNESSADVLKLTTEFLDSMRINATVKLIQLVTSPEDEEFFLNQKSFNRENQGGKFGGIGGLVGQKGTSEDGTSSRSGSNATVDAATAASLGINKLDVPKVLSQMSHTRKLYKQFTDANPRKPRNDDSASNLKALGNMLGASVETVDRLSCSDVPPPPPSQGSDGYAVGASLDPGSPSQGAESPSKRTGSMKRLHGNTFSDQPPPSGLPKSESGENVKITRDKNESFTRLERALSFNRNDGAPQSAQGTKRTHVQVQDTLKKRAELLHQEDTGVMSPTGLSHPGAAAVSSATERREMLIDDYRMRVAVALNYEMRMHCVVPSVSTARERARSRASSTASLTNRLGFSKASADAGEYTQLVVTNLPLTMHAHPPDFMHFVETITDSLPCVCLLVRGSGEEVVTKYG